MYLNVKCGSSRECELDSLAITSASVGVIHVVKLQRYCVVECESF